MMLVRHWLGIICNAILELTSSWLPIILTSIFGATVLNVDLLHYWQKDDWVEELTRKGVPCLDYVHIIGMLRIPICHEIWAICTHCVNMSAYNVFLIGLYLPCCIPFVILILWYGEVMTRATYLIREAMKHKPPDLIMTKLKKFAKLTAKGLDNACRGILQFIKKAYFLLPLFQWPTSVQSHSYCFRATPSEVAHLLSFDTEGDALVTLDNCTTNHVFGDEADFHGSIIPMDPVEVTGLGEGTAMGYGNVKLKFICNQGITHSKILYDVWHLPSASVRMILVPQLDLQMKK